MFPESESGVLPLHQSAKNKSRQLDLNLRPTDYESVALPTAPCRHYKMTVRFELTNKSFADSRLKPLGDVIIRREIPARVWRRWINSPSHQYYKTECKGFEPLCRDIRRWISNPVQLTRSANTPKSRCKNFRRSYPLTELNRPPKLYWLEHCFTSTAPHPGLEPGT